MNKDKKYFTNLSRQIAHALRHEPWLYEIEIDHEGWTQIQQLLDALRETKNAWAHLDKSDLESLVDMFDKKRYEIQGDRIRALYGHSLPGKLLLTPAPPPEIL